MSYQLPDLLTFLTSISSSSSSSSSSSNTEYDGELHINPCYASLPPNNENENENSLSHHLSLQPHPQIALTTPEKSSNKDKLSKTLNEVLNEYNPGLLSCLYLPFLSNGEGKEEEGEEGVEGVMKVVKEWLSVCAIVVEDTVRPGRIIGLMGEKEKMKMCLETIANRLMRFSSFPSNTQTINQIIITILTASQHPPPPPPPPPNSNSTHTRLTEYLNWRINLSGHQLLLKLFIIPLHTHKYTRAVDLILEITVCVIDLFAYNIHQAWSNQNHLNLISYLLLCGGGMTVQVAVNMTGEMIRLRMVELKHELEKTRNEEEGKEKESNGFLTRIFSPVFSSSSSSSSSSNNTDLEIRKTLWNWVSGIIHWAYEVEYFTPDLEGSNKKKRGGEVRDYGWVFLIPNH